ncbi:MAG TPA: class I poly(R)-hydroxyalkanoic acid synthase, partial [Alphaproteobacteria bacterium]|nr:class I poly(R)-hydroxyalkanoic acid synthase [Alphaproteobacteria bacterium]
SFYLRKMYLENKLREPGGIELGGVPIDLGRITIPTFILSTKEDHIAPWKATFAATSLFKGPARFVLAASGHVAGVINPPAARKYGYWTGPIEGEDPDRWLNSAVKHEGSWWTDWDDWNAAQSGEKVPARKPGGGKLVPLADAPGTYVLSR